MLSLGPRLVIAGTHSGVGKTTIATGLMKAFSQAGHSVASAKVGPDFIDPGFHSAATGFAPRNLDPWICGLEPMVGLAARAVTGAELLVVEGVMGLFDGAVDNSASSTANVAEELQAPVVLVVDGSSMSSSVAALVRGYRDHRKSLNLAGVILNRIGSTYHQELLIEALTEIDMPVLGTVFRDDQLNWRERHLGLVPVEENRAEVESSISQLGQLVGNSCDLAKLLSIAQGSRELKAAPPPLPNKVSSQGRARVAVASGEAFTFVYRDNAEALEAAGAELVPFDPLNDEHLPRDCDGVFVGGGFPEVFVSRLAENRSLAADLRHQIGQGLPTWAECGGLLWLCESLDEKPMVGVIPAKAKMTSRLTLGYRNADVLKPNPVASVGAKLRGHEFHYSKVASSKVDGGAADGDGSALQLSSRFVQKKEGFASNNLLATYFHQHLGANPEPARRFVQSCLQANPKATSEESRPETMSQPELG